MKETQTWQMLEVRDRCRGSSVESRPLSGARPEPNRTDAAKSLAVAAAALTGGSIEACSPDNWPSLAGVATRRKGFQL